MAPDTQPGPGERSAAPTAGDTIRRDSAAAALPSDSSHWPGRDTAGRPTMDPGRVTPRSRSATRRDTAAPRASNPAGADSSPALPDTSHRAAGDSAARPVSNPAAPAAAGPGDEWVQWDSATNTVKFKLVAGAPGAKSPFNFNGHVNGEAALVVPPGVNVVVNFINKDGTPHSAVIIDDQGPLPNMASDPAIPRAYTTSPTQGLAQEGTDNMRFKAPDSGSYRIICGVPGHALSGMWIWMKVDPGAKVPSFGPTS